MCTISYIHKPETTQRCKGSKWRKKSSVIYSYASFSDLKEASKSFNCFKKRSYPKVFTMQYYYIAVTVSCSINTVVTPIRNRKRQLFLLTKDGTFYDCYLNFLFYSRCINNIFPRVNKIVSDLTTSRYHDSSTTYVPSFLSSELIVWAE